MHSNLSCYQLKIDYYKYKLFYVSPVVTTKQKPIVDTQNKQESKPLQITTENHQITKKESKRRKEQRKYKTPRKQLTNCQ